MRPRSCVRPRRPANAKQDRPRTRPGDLQGLTGPNNNNRPGVTTPVGKLSGGVKGQTRKTVGENRLQLKQLSQLGAVQEMRGERNQLQGFHDENINSRTCSKPFSKSNKRSSNSAVLPAHTPMRGFGAKPLELTKLDTQTRIPNYEVPAAPFFQLSVPCWYTTVLVHKGAVDSQSSCVQPCATPAPS